MPSILHARTDKKISFRDPIRHLPVHLVEQIVRKLDVPRFTVLPSIVFAQALLSVPKLRLPAFVNRLLGLDGCNPTL